MRAVKIRPTKNRLRPELLQPISVSVPETNPFAGTYPATEVAVKTLRPETPLFCIDTDKLKSNAVRFLNKFQGKTYYAVKSNADPYILKSLHTEGITHFDVASIMEVRLIRSLFPEAEMAFMHPIKSREAIRESYEKHGVRAFVFDCEDELAKIKEVTQGAKDITMMIRLALPKGTAMHPLAGKFGAEKELAAKLLKEVYEEGYACGLTFHVGSQTPDPASYRTAIRLAGEITRAAGAELSVLDVGGGFPIGGLSMEIEPLETFFEVIAEEIEKIDLPKTCDLWAEPGRGLVGDTTEVIVRVELRKDDALYLNDGGYGTLFDLCWLGNRNAMRVIRSEGEASPKTAPFKLFGPTCDSVDKIEGPFELAEDIKEGDWIAVSGLGAYGFAMQTGFNGFYARDKAEIAKKAEGEVVSLQTAAKKKRFLKG